MRRNLALMGTTACLLLASHLAHAQGGAGGVDCSAVAVSAQGAGGLAAISPEFGTARMQFPALNGPLALPLGPAPSLDQALLSATCGSLQSTLPHGAARQLPAPVVAGPVVPATAANIVPALPGATITPEPGVDNAVIDPATYKPRTEFDNTPWRFSMSKDGQRMTADDFAAWMEARGIRISKGVPRTAETAAAQVDQASVPAVPATAPAPAPVAAEEEAPQTSPAEVPPPPSP
jgi:hypothetical protein